MLRQLVRYLGGSILELSCLGQLFPDVVINQLGFGSSASLLCENEIVPNTEFVLQEERRATALHVSLGHDADAVTKNVSFIHVVSRENDDATFLVLLDHVPETPPRCGVHA